MSKESKTDAIYIVSSSVRVFAFIIEKKCFCISFNERFKNKSEAGVQVSGITPMFSLLSLSLEAEIGLRSSSLNYVNFNLLAVHKKPLAWNSCWGCVKLT